MLQNITVYPAMNIILALKRPFIWLSRVRHRCGYGVHSPFAFELITCLFYEKTPYYAYKELAQEEKKQKRNHGKGWRNESLKVKRLLFRLVNRIQPGTIIDFGTPSSSSLYLQSGKATADYTFATRRFSLYTLSSESGSGGRCFSYLSCTGRSAECFRDSWHSLFQSNEEPLGAIESG